MDERILTNVDPEPIPEPIGFTNQSYYELGSTKNLVDSGVLEHHRENECKISSEPDQLDIIRSDFSFGRLTYATNNDVSRKRLSAISDTRELMTSPHNSDHIIQRDSHNVGPKLRQRSVSRDYDDDTQINTRVTDHGVGNISPRAEIVDEEKILNVSFTIKPKIVSNNKATENTHKPQENAPTVISNKLSNGRQLNRTKSQIERMKVLRIPRDSSFRRLARQLSRKDKRGDAPDDVDGETSGLRPRTFFDLSIVTMCCCVSPLGLVAVIMSVLSDANHKAGHRDKAVKYSRLALILSILGMITSVALAITLLLLFRYPWQELQQP